MIPRHIAILIDGGYFLKRLPRLVRPSRCRTPARIVGCLRWMCFKHVEALTGCTKAEWKRHLYRIFYYDAHPYDSKAHHPVANRPIDYDKSEVAQHRRAIFDRLRRERKVALRLGKVIRERDWIITPRLTKRLLKTRNLARVLASLPEPSDEPVTLTLSVSELTDLRRLHELWAGVDSQSVELGLRQKGVDMRIGIDIASLALKRQVDAIILVAGDSDFVPAAKLARREGIDFILDPMWQKVKPDLFEHIDGLQSGLPNPNKSRERQDTSTVRDTAGNQDV